MGLPLEAFSSEHYFGYMCRLFVGILAIFLALDARPGASHPHVWVTGTASFKIEDTKLTRIGMRWQFDAFFSQVLGADFDINSDGIFDSEETQAMKNQVFTSLKDFDYFTHLRIESSTVEQTFAGVDNFSISDDRGEMIFTFELILNNPIDPTKEAVGLSLYDPSIYVDLILDGEEPVNLAGAEDLGCDLEYRQGNEVNSQSYFIIPQEVWLNCNAS